MKQGRMHNDFDTLWLKEWFATNTECWICGQAHHDSAHHILGRGSSGSICESSILNAAPVNNNKCHLPIHGQLMQKENQKILLRKTVKYLLSRGYVFNKLDELFIEKYKSFYLDD